MAFLTRIKLDANKQSTMAAMLRPSLIHGAIEEAFDKNGERKLWRIDKVGGSLFLLITSESIPGTANIVSQFGDENVPVETKDYSVLINKVSNGDLCRFKLTANPTYSVTDESGINRRRSHISEKYQINWILQQAKSNGFDIESVSITSSSWKEFDHKKSDTIKFKAVSYEGICKITDAEIFKTKLTSGIGREKAYGMGMITIMRARR